MSSPLPDLSVSIAGVTYGVACIAAVVFVVKLARPCKLDAIPKVGSSGWFGFLWAGFKFLTTDGVSVIQEGYKKHKRAPFKVADRYGWTVVLSNREHIEELRKAPDDELSFGEAINNQLNTRYTLGDEVHDIPYHVTVVRSQLTRNLGVIYPEIRDEIVTTFEEVLDLRGNEWKSVLASSAVQKVVCRTNNRVFVGLPLCHNPDWIDLSVHTTLNIIKTGFFIGLFPESIRPLAARFFTGVAQDIMRCEKHLGPIIEERLKHSNECGDSCAEKRNDLLSWLMEEAKGPQLTVKRLTAGVLFTSFTAFHTTSTIFTHALLYLAANPQYIQPLREEVEAIVEKEGWSKASLVKMRKVDSFLRECQRIEGMGALSVVRKALKDFTFSDGTFIPKGTMVGVATHCLHHEEKFYENADVFQPFRFAEMQEEDEEGGKYQFVSTSMEYLPFGHGRHACPGRFFVATGLKTMLAHIVTAYDVKLEDGATRPRSVHFGPAIAPNPSAKVLFRRRVD